MENKSKIWLPLLFALTTAIGMVLGFKMQGGALVNVIHGGEGEDDFGMSFMGGKVDEILNHVTTRYVENDSLENLEEEAIQAIMSDLDPHSHYIPVEEMQEVSEDLEGNFDGIGIEFMSIKDTINVVNVIPGGPSEQVGLMSGDKIVQIQDSIVGGKKLENSQIVKKLKGPKGTIVKVGIKRGNNPKLISFNIKRDKIPMNSVDIGYMLDEKTAYIKVNRFAATTYKEFMEVVEKLMKEKNMKDLVLDLRQNPGGYLDQAVNILSQFFREKDRLLVYTKGRKAERSDFETTGRPFFDIQNITVLIDEGSASASEIVAGAIQDWDRGVVIGRRSFGKGLVQEQFQLSDGSALRLTTSKYFTPSGRCIQKEYEGKSNYDDDLMERWETGELTDENIAKKAVGKDTAEYFTANGRIVRGGGGIMPDVFVPMGKDLLNETNFIVRAHISGFSFQYKNENKANLPKTFAEFDKNFQVDDKLWNAFNKYIKETSTNLDPKINLEKGRTYTNEYLKAMIAKQMYGAEAYYKIINKNDKVIIKALESLKNPKVILTKK